MAYKVKTVKNYKSNEGLIHISKGALLLDYNDLVAEKDGEYNETDLVSFALIDKPNQGIISFQVGYVLTHIRSEE